MTNTPRFDLSLPEDGDSPNGPSQLQDLAEDVEARLGYAGAQGGKSIIATEQSRTNVAYGLLGTPDRVQDIVLPTDGLIFALYQAQWKSSNGFGAAWAAFFLGSNQLKVDAHPQTGGAPVVQEAGGPGPADTYAMLGTGAASGWNSAGVGLNSWLGNDLVAKGNDVSTGQIIGTGPNTSGQRVASGPVAIFAAAGTYDLSVQFKASVGSVTAKNRKLWVWTKEFPTSGI